MKQLTVEDLISQLGTLPPKALVTIDGHDHINDAVRVVPGDAHENTVVILGANTPLSEVTEECRHDYV